MILVKKKAGWEGWRAGRMRTRRRGQGYMLAITFFKQMLPS